MKLNEKLRVSLANNGWTQAYFAKQMCVSPKTVQKWVSGDNHPSVDTIKEMSVLLNIPTDELIDDSVDVFQYYVVDKYITSSEDRFPERFRDGEHTIIEAGLKGEALLHRFKNAAGCDYSAIYYAKREIWSQVRERESLMIKEWNEWGYKDLFGA